MWSLSLIHIFYHHTTNIIGNGVALDLNKFVDEIKSLQEAGVEPNLLVSDRVQVVMPYHILFDQYEEERLGGRSFGSTKSGIAPFFSDKYAKIGFQICELFDEASALEKLERVIEMTKPIDALIHLGDVEGQEAVSYTHLY